MSDIRNAMDTFLHFLADNLAGLIIHPLRTDVNDAAAAVFQLNSINVHFMNIDPGVSVSTMFAVVDLVYDTELVAVDALNSVWTVLNQAFFCQLYDYSGNPASPVAVGTRHLFWPHDGVKFRKVMADHYAHYTSSLRLQL